MYGNFIQGVRSAKGWMYGDLMKRWIRQAHSTQKALLVMYSFHAQYAKDIHDLLATATSEVVFIPGECTPKLQPLDVSLNKPFKPIILRLLLFPAVRHERPY